MKKIYTLTIFTMMCAMLSGQNVLLVEHFDYPEGSEIRDFGWTAHSAGATNPLTVTDGGLMWSQTQYLGSGFGNAVAVSNTGSDENRPFNEWVNSGSVYTSFLINVPDEVNADNAGYFFHVGQYGNTENPDFTDVSTMFRGRTFVAPGSSASTFRMGLNFNAAAVPTDEASLSAELNIGETYLVVMKYEVVEGDDNDLVSLYVFADGDDISAEPASAAIGPFGGTAGDLAFVQLVALRQYSESQNVLVDGIIVQDSWDLVAVTPPFTGPELVGPPSGTTLDVAGDPGNEAVISWTEAQNAPGAVTYEWQLALSSAGNFDAPLATLASDDDGAATTLTVSFGALDDLLASLGVNVGETVEAIWRVVATSGDQTAPSVNTFDIDIVRGEVLGLNSNKLNSELLIYPNPASGTAFVRLGDIPSGSLNISIVNPLGQTLRSSSRAAQSGQLIEISLDGIPAGLYFALITIDNLQGTKRLLIQ